MNDQQAIDRLFDILKAATASYPGGVYLVVGRHPRGQRMRLAGRRSPLGDVCCVTRDGKGTTCVFDAADVMAWCCARLKDLGVEVEVRAAEEEEEPCSS